MSFTDRLLLWLHIAFALFTIGPLTVATMSTPRYIRTRNLPVLRFVTRTTRIYAVISLGVLVIGIILAQLRSDFSHPWLSVSMTLFVVALALLLLIMRDQHRAVVALDGAAKAEAAKAEAATAEAPGAGGPPGAGPAGGEQPAAPEAAPAATAATEIPQLASVERGRIASLAGLVSLIWLVVLALMVWQP